MPIDPEIFAPVHGDAAEAAKFCGILLQTRNIDFEAMLARGYRQFLQLGSIAIDIGAHAWIPLHQTQGRRRADRARDRI